ncbi:MAG: enoyl-CoA hydratase/isomerase family protein [Nostoc sp.]|uniref:enoyl-CoA hydratase/isomerase family protein n=1 Tax=Nostoc sp. TaxID=1180 RepID=UPI002FF8BEA3
MELIVEAVRYKIDSGVAQIALVQPQTGNALNPSLINQLSQALQAAIADSSCRAIVLRAEGTDFCKGLDLEWILQQGGRPQIELFQSFVDCLQLICHSRLPVIACVEGNVTGGGLGLVAACDLVIANENVIFMLPEVIIGMIPALIAPFLLRRLTIAQLKYLTLSSRGIDSLEAKAFGLVDEVATEGMAITLNRQLQRLFRSSPEAIAASKQYFEQLYGSDLQRQTNIALNQLVSWLAQPGALEGIQSFTEGFSPPWFQKYRGKAHV